MTKLFSYIMILISFHTSSMASDDEAPEKTNPISVFSYQFEPIACEGEYDPTRDTFLQNIASLINQLDPDFIHVRGDSKRVMALQEISERERKYSHNFTNIVSENGTQVLAHTQIFRTNGYNPLCCSSRTRSSNASQKEQFLPIQRYYGGLVIGGSQCLPSDRIFTGISHHREIIKERILDTFHFDLGPSSKCEQSAAQIMDEWALECVKIEPRSIIILTGNFNDSDEQLTLVKQAGLLASASTQFFFRSLDTGIFSESLGINAISGRRCLRVIGTECDDVFYKGNFTKVKTFLFPISKEGQEIKDFKQYYYQCVDTTLAKRLPILATFEL